MRLHGLGKSWNRVDSERLMHKLTLDGYLGEIHVASKDGIVNTYVKTGPKADLLIQGKAKVCLFFMLPNPTRSPNMKKKQSVSTYFIKGLSFFTVTKAVIKKINKCLFSFYSDSKFIFRIRVTYTF